VLYRRVEAIFVVSTKPPEHLTGNVNAVPLVGEHAVVLRVARGLSRLLRLDLTARMTCAPYQRSVMLQPHLATRTGIALKSCRRKRLLRALDIGLSQTEAARLFGVGTSSIKRGTPGSASPARW
jgi:hypothetical protein